MGTYQNPGKEGFQEILQVEYLDEFLHLRGFATKAISEDGF